MECTGIDIVKCLQEIGLKSGDAVLVHSSLKSLGHVIGGPMTVINAILAVVGTNGSIIVPTLTGKREDSKEAPPVFDVRNTPCWTGIIAETVRKMDGARRSCHPTHSVSGIGKMTDRIIEGHEKSNSPCDMESPYYKMSTLNGYILLIGVDQESNTSIHSCEELAGVPYHLQKEYTKATIKGYHGEDILVTNRLHNWNKRLTDFNKLDNLYYEEKIMKIRRIGETTMRLIHTADMFAYTIKILEKDPSFLIKDFA